MEVKCTGRYIVNYILLLFFLIMLILQNTIVLTYANVSMSTEDSMALIFFNAVEVIVIFYLAMFIRNYEVRVEGKIIYYRNWLGINRQYSAEQIKSVKWAYKAGYTIKFKNARRIKLYGCYCKNCNEVGERIKELLAEEINE